MIKAIVKTFVNAIWTFFVLMLICQVITPTETTGFILIAVYAVVLIVYRPMKPFFKTILTPNLGIPAERQLRNKVYSFVFLTIKMLLLVSCVGATISGAVLYKIFILKSLAIKLHYLFAYWAFVLSAVQLGVNANITIITRSDQKLQKICHCAGYAGVLIGIVTLFRSSFVTALFSLNENIISLTVFQGSMLLVGAVSAGISISRLMCRSIEK